MRDDRDPLDAASASERLDRMAQGMTASLDEDGQRLRLALDAAGLGLWQWHFATGQMTCSEAAQRIAGLPPEGVADVATFQGLVHPEDVDAVWAMREAAGQGCRFESEYRIVRPDGTIRWVAQHAQCQCDEQGVPVRLVGTVADITERKQAEILLRQRRDELEGRMQERNAALTLANQKLNSEVAERRATEAQVRELFNQIVTTEEDTRRRFAREIHDSMGQHVTALIVGLKAIHDSESMPPAMRHRVAHLIQAARRLDDDVDRISRQLHPAILDDLGLEDALLDLVRTCGGEEGGVAIDVHVAGLRGRRFARPLESTVYRFVQEALTNVRKHASASEVSLIAECRHGVLRAIVEDNGRGFDPSARGGGAHSFPLGLRGMAERASQAGGRLEIESSPGHGTTLFLWIPLSEMRLSA